MLRNSFLALACTLALSGSVWADTPVGPGATGIGGTGSNAADARVRDREGGGSAPKRQDGTPLDQADANVRAGASPGAATRRRSHRKGRRRINGGLGCLWQRE